MTKRGPVSVVSQGRQRFSIDMWQFMVQAVGTPTTSASASFVFPISGYHTCSYLDCWTPVAHVFFGEPPTQSPSW